MLKRCSNIYSTSEHNHQTFNKIFKLKVVLAAILESKSMLSNMAANTNYATLLKNQSAIKYLLKYISSQIWGVR